MRLSKYQKARLLEYEWDVVEHDNIEDNTCWLQLDESDGEIFSHALHLLNRDSDNVDKLNILIVASKVSTHQNVGLS